MARPPKVAIEERREKLRRLLAGSGRALSDNSLAQAIGCDRGTVRHDRAVLLAEVPPEARAQLPAHTLLIFEHVEQKLLHVLSGQGLAPEQAERIAERLLSLQERRIRVAGMLGILDLKERPSSSSGGLAMGARFDPRSGLVEFMLQSVPEMSEDQQASFIKRATLIARNGNVESGVSR